LYPLTSLRPLIESIANLAAVDADIFQIPIAKVAQSDKVRLMFAVCDHAVDETATPLRITGAAWGGVVLSIVMDFPSQKGLRSALRPWDQHARCRVPGLSENGDLFSKCP
jgi:hypothetical protein